METDTVSKPKSQANVTQPPQAEDYYKPHKRRSCPTCGWKGSKSFWLNLLEDALLIYEEAPKELWVHWTCKRCSTQNGNTLINRTLFFKNRN